MFKSMNGLYRFLADQCSNIKWTDSVFNNNDCSINVVDLFLFGKFKDDRITNYFTACIFRLTA